MTGSGFGEVAERLRRSTVHLQVEGIQQGFGSGILCTSDGLVVTNAHVARGPSATVGLWDGRQFEAPVTARDPRRDLASLKISAGDLPAAAWGDSGALRAGELVVAIGNPLGFLGALTTGVVHAVGPVPGIGRQPWVQADVRLAPGNSGGPLADAQGRVIGINTMIVRGLGLAVPSDAVQAFLRRGASSEPQGRSLGVTVRPVPLRTRAGPRVGLLVLEVLPGSAAAASSLMTGDLLIGANGSLLRSLDDLGEMLDRAAEVIHLDFLRGDHRKPRSVSVRLGARSAEAA